MCRFGIKMHQKLFGAQTRCGSSQEEKEKGGMGGELRHLLNPTLTTGYESFLPVSQQSTVMFGIHLL